MPLTIPEIAHVRTRDPRLADALDKIVEEINLTQKTTGVAPPGRLPTPPTLGGITVTAANGLFDVALTDLGVEQPGTYYFVEHDTSPSFGNAHTEGPSSSRNFHLALGNATRYFRAFSAYLGGSVRSPIIVFGGTTPTGVPGGGGAAGPTPSPTQGSGTSQVPGFGFGTPANQVPNASTNKKPVL
jgi:hypothetical protein